MFMITDRRNDSATRKVIGVLAGAGLAALPLILALSGAVLAAA